MKCDHNIEESFCGIATIGERGQIVIPADARKKLGVAPGEKLMVMYHPSNQGLVLFRIDAMREFITSFLDGINRISEDHAAQKDEKEEQGS